MAWYIASVPFWVLGVAFALGGLISMYLVLDNPSPTDRKQVREFKVSLAVALTGSLWLYIAARMVS